ncbi:MULTISPECIES: LLM class flavin-dependent oxidoreductase [unclassified Bacillus (in: firmicutes)]|uniref:LLM class flavin-dependent oxidoreductase n=1 Tax=unclassified Bacillus (in: firmicutes) TaxID=185979 RepID=UPI0022832455|nr:LLM class flavin-dependent oxidoreductase [Bacillus sp. S20C3]MCY8289645.1 LLM class flavin-dependent oxidoreductase [Bacillus sp. N13C7]MCY8638384.1 LLM class flavin-dependent oxidoreductase [Bacillus sp. S17B2]MCY9144101.1 LLM class flavin-dependent oxidoreductase [Bacillus sp. T9C1]
MNNRKMKNKRMILGVVLGNNFGNNPATWRMPHVDPGSFTNIDVTVEQVRTAERGGMQFVFLPDRLFMQGDLATSPSLFNIDPIITLSAVAQATERIGLIGTASTSFTEPYLLARQLKALDVFSRGRAGWNAVPSFEPQAFANFGKKLPPRENKYERLHETIQVVQALWGSWGYEAGQPDQAGMYANPAHIRPVNLQGKHVGARGPLPVPPSEQGQPVIMMPASSGYGLQAAGMYANVVIGMPSSIEESRALRYTVRESAVQAGRDREEIKFVVFAPFTGFTAEQAADHLQEWFEAEAADGFVMNFDDFHTEIGEFVDRVVPILRERGLFHDGYEGKTLRDHLGLPPQYGLDPRIATGSNEN